MLILIRVFLFFSFLTLNNGILQAATTKAHPDLSQKLLTDVYQPSHEHFSILAKNLASEISGLCGSTPGSKTYSLQVSFTNLLEAYSAIELFRVGPLLNDNRKNRLFFWPDTRRAGERQLRALLNSDEVVNIPANKLAEKSVALQGFATLERLLFTQSLLPAEKAPQCHLVAAVVQNIANMAEELSEEWQSDSDFNKSLLQPDTGSDYFRTQDEVVRNLYTQAKVGLDIVLNTKLALLLSRDKKKVTQSPMWRSQRTVSMLAGNIKGLERLLLESGLLAQTRYQKELRVEFQYLEHVLSKLTPTIYLQNTEGDIKPELRILLNQLAAVVARIRYVVNIEVAESFGISAGFNSEDGD